MVTKLLTGVVALGLFGTFTLSADTPARAAKKEAMKTVTPDPNRKIVRWPGGWMYLDQPGVIYHDDTAPKGPKGTGATNVISNSANGVGNKIEIDNGDTKGVTILHNVRNGFGNSIKVTPQGPVIETPAKPVAPSPKTTKTE